MKNSDLSVGSILSNGVKLGVSNYLALFVNFILFIFTIWIPYLNVGTYIGLTTGLPLKMSKGESISMTEIFNSEYRKFFGEYFLLLGFRVIGTYMAFLFMIVPGIVLSLCWYIADLLFLDGKEGIIDSLKKSNQLIYGNKWSIFFAGVLLVIGFYIFIFLSGYLLREVPFLMGIILFVLISLLVPVSMGIKAFVYKTLTAEEEVVEETSPL